MPRNFPYLNYKFNLKGNNEFVQYGDCGDGCINLRKSLNNSFSFLAKFQIPCDYLVKFIAQTCFQLLFYFYTYGFV